MNKTLRHGYTTGTCAAAAARGAALMIARQELVNEVTILLPAGISVAFQLHGQTFSNNSAACFVVKDAGDDPDVTNGAEVHALLSFLPPPLTGGGQGVGEATTNDDHGNSPPTLTLPFRPAVWVRQGGGNIFITGGAGIGKVTKPGLAVPPGEWAINPVPRRMIEQAIQDVFPNRLLRVEISIPDGDQRAKKTLNARLGIIGGLSILGTTGIVRPISAKAWTDTIDAALDVAKACGCENVVLSTGRTSEMAAQKHLAPLLTEEAFIMMGDHIAYALRACLQRGFENPIVACQFAKLLKIACGYENTHAAASELDLATLREWSTEQGLPGQTLDLIDSANTARQIIIASDFDPILLELVCRHAHDVARSHAPGILPSFLVADYGGKIVFSS